MCGIRDILLGRMKRVLTAIVLIAVVFSLLYWGNLVALDIFSCIVACLAAYEYCQLTKAAGMPVPVWWMMAAIVFFFWSTDWEPLLAPLPMMSFLGLSLFVYSTFWRELREALPIAAAGFFGLMYIAYPLSLIPPIRAHDGGFPLLIFLMLVVWTGDTVALYVGKAYGKRKMAPRLSPGKTWEGAVGSLAGSLIITLILFGIDQLLTSRGFAWLHINQPLWLALIVATLVNIAAQAGDLMESAIKRGSGVKDSGSLLPGHGGILDRIDALLVALPVFYYLLLWQDARGLSGL